MSVSSGWTSTRRELVALVGEQRAAELIERYAPIVPAGYDELNWPATAAVDFVHLDDLSAEPGAIATTMLRFAEAAPDEWRFRVYRRGAPLALADLLPLLDQLGFRALDERSFSFDDGSGRPLRLHDVGVSVGEGTPVTEEERAELQRTFRATFAGTIEVDGLNRLVLRGGLTGRQVEVLRAYSRYLRQIGFPFGQPYIEATLCRHAAISAQLIGLFESRFDPTQVDAEQDVHAARRQELAEALDAVPTLDDDRTLRAVLALIDATVRTNVFRPAVDGGARPVLAFKLDGALVPDLPAPRPKFEIWVCSPRVEGVHLRHGLIARGGLRWSDRREDFRTEILGLVKAQIVKNAVIVPTGAKGGFVVKRPPSDPEGLRAEGSPATASSSAGCSTSPTTSSTARWCRRRRRCATTVTTRTSWSPPTRARRRSATSPTRSRRPTASGWGMRSPRAAAPATTTRRWASRLVARGRACAGTPWRSARTSTATRSPSSASATCPATCSATVCCGPQHVQLLAAFDHRHVFIDPDPDPAASFAERARLFALPRSSWADYDSQIISTGGGVYPRTAKRIEISERARQCLGADRTTFTPSELMSAILRAPVDLLWNGGIGTYVKASTETNAEVGDRANDALRVDGDELRCRIVGEGGNLGLTQRGRIEYARSGGLINTDAIDNSAGVDCSDHEVNIKILLGAAIDDGALARDARDALLVEMTDEVGEQVLDDNRAQTLALAIARKQTLSMANVHARYLRHARGRRAGSTVALEFLPTSKQLAERQANGVGLTTPEFSVLIAYTKSANVHMLERSDTPDDPYLEPELMRYFPSVLRERFAAQIDGHRLRREIIATQVANQMVNLSGISFDHRMTEDTGAGRGRRHPCLGRGARHLRLRPPVGGDR